PDGVRPRLNPHDPPFPTFAAPSCVLIAPGPTRTPSSPVGTGCKPPRRRPPLKNRGQQDFLFRIGRAKAPEPFNFFFVSILIFWIYFLHVQEEFFSLVQHFSSKLPLVDLG